MFGFQVIEQILILPLFKSDSLYTCSLMLVDTIYLDSENVDRLLSTDVLKYFIYCVIIDSGSSSSSEDERPKRSHVKNGEVGRRRRHSPSRSASPSPRKRQKETSPR